MKLFLKIWAVVYGLQMILLLSATQEQDFWSYFEASDIMVIMIYDAMTAALKAAVIFAVCQLFMYLKRQTA